MNNAKKNRSTSLTIIFPALLGLLFLMYIMITYLSERNAIEKHEKSYNNLQSLQTLFAANGIQQCYTNTEQIGRNLVNNIISVIEADWKTDKILANLVRNTVDSYSQVLGIAVYFENDNSIVRWFDDNQVAREISEEWRSQYGVDLTRSHARFVPPFYIHPNMQYYGMIMNDTSTYGRIQVIAVVDIHPMIERFVSPMRTGSYGAGYILDGLGNIVYDHESEIIGRNVFDGMHESYDQLKRIDKRLISEAYGSGEYAFTVKRNGQVSRKLISWHSANMGDQHLVIAMASPVKEVNRDMASLRMNFYLLTALFVLSIMAGSILYYRYVLRKTQQERFGMLKAIMDAIPDMLYFKDRNRNFLGCNTAFEKFIGHTSDEIIGKTFYDFFPDYRNPYYDKYEEHVLKHGEVQHFEEWNEEFLHRMVALDTIITPLLDENGEVENIVGVSRDITDKYFTLEKLKQSEERYNITQHAAGIISWEWDLDADMVTFSQEAVRLLDFQQNELTKSLARIREYIHHDDAQVFDNKVIDCKETKADFQSDLRFQIHDEKVQWFSIRGSYIQSEGQKASRYAGILHDITQRKQNEMELKQLARAIDYAAEIIIITEPDGTLTYVNPAFEKITGYMREDVIGKTLGFLRSGKHSNQFYKEFFDTIMSGKVWRGTFINKRKDGSLFEVESTISAIRNSQNVIVKFVGVMKDVTVEKELKNQLIHTQKMEAIGTLAGGIAHDFNNILSAVIGYGELALLDVPSDNPSYTGIKEIVKAGYRAKGVIQQIMTFSRRADMERRPVQLKTIIDETKAMLERTLPANISMDIDIQEDVVVNADPSRLHQILMNLCTNAYQAMKPKGGRLTVRLTETTADRIPSQFAHIIKPGAYARISVIDTGCGMPPEVIKRIFEPYFTTKAQQGGSGLGLSTVHGIIRENDGVIDVQSKQDSGTIVDVYLPRLTKEAMESSKQQTLLHSQESYRIMFVDDDTDIASMIRIGVGRTGHHIQTYTNPEEAVEVFRKDPWQFDLIVSDISMPRISGLDLLLEIRNTRPEMPVILCTGHESFTDLDSAYRTGADLIIIKPITWQILVEKISELMKQKKKNL